jgi:hypothetical protein
MELAGKVPVITKVNSGYLGDPVPEIEKGHRISPVPSAVSLRMCQDYCSGVVAPGQVPAGTTAFEKRTTPSSFEQKSLVPVWLATLGVAFAA